MQSLVREVQGHAGRIAGTVRLYACPSAVVGQLPERLKRFLDQHREVRVTLHVPKRAADIYTAKLSVVTRPLKEGWAQ